jgi:hypothetical protein
LYEEVVLESPLPLWERDRVRGKVATTSLLIQAKSAVSWQWGSDELREERRGVEITRAKP